MAGHVERVHERASIRPHVQTEAPVAGLRRDRDVERAVHEPDGRIELRDRGLVEDDVG